MEFSTFYILFLLKHAGVNIFPFAPRYLGAEFYKINDLGQDFGGLNNKTLYTGFKATINRDIHLITFTKACNFVFNCCKIQEISMKIGLFTHYCTLPFFCWEEFWFFGIKFITLGAEIVIFWKIFTPDWTAQIQDG